MGKLDENAVRKVRKVETQHESGNTQERALSDSGMIVLEPKLGWKASPEPVRAGEDLPRLVAADHLPAKLTERPSAPDAGLPARVTPARAQLDPQFLQEATKLVYRLFRTPGGPTLGSVLFCGADQAANSSEVCCAAAEILAAQVQKSVCVVDSNFRSPAVQGYFGLEHRRGLTDAILQTGALREFVQQVPPGNLWVMTCGAAGSEAIFSNSERLRARMLELRKSFDYVLIDVAPAGLFLDAVIVGQYVEGAVLVIDSKLTRRETAVQAKQALDSGKVRILGAVLHGRSSAQSR